MHTNPVIHVPDDLLGKLATATGAAALYLLQIPMQGETPDKEATRLDLGAKLATVQRIYQDWKADGRFVGEALGVEIQLRERIERHTVATVMLSYLTQAHTLIEAQTPARGYARNGLSGGALQLSVLSVLTVALDEARSARLQPTLQDS